MTKGRGKKAKKEDLKAFEFLLLSLGDEDEDDWMISDDKIILRGLIQLSPESSETCGKSVDKPARLLQFADE